VSSIYISRSVDTISPDAFVCLNSREKIIVDTANRRYCVDGECLIDLENEKLVLGCKNSEIPDCGIIKSIGTFAFKNREDIKRAAVPDGVTHIGGGAFAGCTKLEQITLPEGLECISSGAFYGCRSLKTVYVPASVKRVEVYAFSECKNLTITYGGSEDEWNKACGRWGYPRVQFLR
jgi:hypothetical protein